MIDLAKATDVDRQNQPSAESVLTQAHGNLFDSFAIAREPWTLGVHEHPVDRVTLVRFLPKQREFLGQLLECGGFISEYRIGDDSTTAALMLWARTTGADRTIKLSALAGRFFKSELSLLLLEHLGLSNGQVVLCSEGFLSLPGAALPTWATGSDRLPPLPLLVGDAERLLPEDPDRWNGIHFQGDIGLANGSDFAGLGVLSSWLGSPTLPMTGSLVEEEPGRVFVRLAWTPDPNDARRVLALRADADWAVTFTGAAVEGLIVRSSEYGESRLEALTIAGVLRLAGYDTGVTVTVDLKSSQTRIVAEPRWEIGLGWIQSLAGEQSFAEGGGAFLVQSGSNQPSLKVERVEAGWRWGQGGGLQTLAVTIGTGSAPWKVLGGELRATLGVACDFSDRGKTRFDCRLTGTWTWRTLALTASIDTGTGELYACYEDNRDQDFLGSHLGGGAKKGLDARSLEIAFLEVSGNYRDRTCQLELETAGSLAFALTDEVTLRIAQPMASGSFDFAGSDWSLTLAARVDFEVKGQKDKIFPEGIGLRGEIDSTKLLLELDIPVARLGLLLGAFFKDGGVPAALRDVKLERLRLDYVYGKRLSVSSAGDIGLNGSLALRGFAFSLEDSDRKDGQGPAKTVFKAKAQFVWAGSGLAVEIAGGSGRWTVTGNADALDVGGLLNALAGEKLVTQRLEAKNLQLDLTLGDGAGAEAEITLKFDFTAGANTLGVTVMAVRKSGVWNLLFHGDLTLSAASLPIGGKLLDGLPLKLHVQGLYLKGAAAFPAYLEKCGWAKVDEGPNFCPGVPAGAPSAGTMQELNPVQPPPQPRNAAPAPATPPATPGQGGGLTWTAIKRSYGPLRIERIGYGTDTATRSGRIAIDAGLEFAGLRLQALGLGMEIAVPSFDVRPKLDGLGIDIRRGPLTIAGSLVKRDDTYAGTAEVRTATFSLAAAGQFNLKGTRPSFFLYCCCRTPLGGPPAFFVEGLAGGMGYDTRLTMPAVSGVKDFILVRALQDGIGSASDFDSVVRPSPGEMWFAAGVRFSSFKLLKTSAVVTLSLGERVEADLFGLSELRLPPVGPAIAQIGVAVRGQFAPQRGDAWVQGEIVPGSYLFHPDCRVSGGFAFKVWFGNSHKGDFFASIGGFHPQFPVPQHYINVPRLAIEWQVNPNLSLSGSAYLAITARAVMAGGSLHLLWQSDNLRASLFAEAHFLAVFEPFRYEVRAHVAVDAVCRVSVWGYSIEKSVHVGASLLLQGPPMSGVAEVDVVVTTLKIDFGQPPSPPAALPWERFRERLLPKDLLAVRAIGALPEPATGTAPAAAPAADGSRSRPLVVRIRSGAAFELMVETAVPLYAAKLGTAPVRLDASIAKKVRVQAMDQMLGTSELSVSAFAADWKTERSDDLRTLVDECGLTATVLTGTLAPALWPDPGEATNLLNPAPGRTGAVGLRIASAPVGSFKPSPIAIKPAEGTCKAWFSNVSRAAASGSRAWAAGAGIGKLSRSSGGAS